MRCLLGVIGMRPGEVDQRIDRVFRQRPATGPKARHQEVGEFLARQRAERVGAGHLQQRRIALVHGAAEQGLARPEEGVRHVLLVLDHGAQLPQESDTEFHQVLELVEDDDDPFLLALARDHFGLLKNLLE